MVCVLGIKTDIMDFVDFSGGNQFIYAYQRPPWPLTGRSGTRGGIVGTVRVGIIGGGRPPPPLLPGGGGGPRPGGADGAALGGAGAGGCLFTGGGGFLLGPPPGDEGGTLDEALGVGIQSLLTGGGAGVLTVAIETSPMIRIASLQA
jgi:hypothetical protein